MMCDLVIIDRDGVVNIDCPESVKSWENFDFIEKVPQAIALLNKAGICVVVATNQAVVGRQELSAEGLQEIHDRMQAHLKEKGAFLDAIYVCTHTQFESSLRRKPMPGMLLEAMADFKTMPDKTVMVGDDLRDLQAAVSAGCRKILVKTGKGEQVLTAGIPADVGAVTVLDDLYTAVQEILR